MASSKAAAVAVLVLCAFAGAFASISGNPDSWELPPAAPNYYYQAQGLIGDGALATLVTIRDPLTSDTAYNTSLFAFSVSGGLVPLNYIALNDGHCRSYVVADVLVCDFQSSGGGTTILYQLAVHAGAGGANRLVIVDQATAPAPNSLAGTVRPLYIPATGHIVALQYLTQNTFTVYDITRNTSESQGLSVTSLGTIAVSSPNSMYVSDDGTELTVAENGGFVTFAYPGLQLLRSSNPVPAQGSAYILGITGAATQDFGFAIYQSGASSTGLTYQPIDFYDGTTVGSAFADSSTGYYSSGLYTATSGTPFSGTVGPCVYVQGYAEAQSKTQYGLISQVRVPTNAGAAFTIEAQLPIGSNVQNTMVANAGYLFTIYQEIMYRYIASC